jgi:DNA-binding response OmpR family regulator
LLRFPSVTNGARILVVDDDPVILRLIEVNLDLEGFEVVTAERGEDAIAKARETSPDLILLDLMMPEMSGWEIAERLREDDKAGMIPLVFLSARTQDEDRRRGEDLGVAGYVTKPFDPADLVATIRKLTARR